MMEMKVVLCHSRHGTSHLSILALFTCIVQYSNNKEAYPAAVFFLYDTLTSREMPSAISQVRSVSSSQYQYRLPKLASGT